MKVLFLGGPWHGLFRNVVREPRYADHPYCLPNRVVIGGTLVRYNSADVDPLAPVTTTEYDLRQVHIDGVAVPVGVVYVSSDYTGPAMWSDPEGSWDVFDHPPTGG